MLPRYDLYLQMLYNQVSPVCLEKMQIFKSVSLKPLSESKPVDAISFVRCHNRQQFGIEEDERKNYKTIIN